MAGGKLPPRQKMIGMMYLVLTALLAMNVSKDILDAFIVVNDGIENSTSTFADKTSIYYTKFAAAAVDSETAKPFKAKADNVKKMTDDLYDYIKKLKHHLITVVDKTPEGSHDSLYKISNVQSKDNYDLPTLTMGLAEPATPKDGEWTAVDLRKKINKYQADLLDLFKENKEAQDLMKKSLAVLETPDPKPGTSDDKTWEEANFYHVPLAAVITILSKIQSDVRSAEAEAVAKLYENIDAAGVSFSKVDGFAYAKKAYVMDGDSFAAQIFTAAYNDLDNPEIFIGAYDSVAALTETDENKIMKGQKGEGWDATKNGGWYQLKDVEAGKGYLKIREGVGIHDWGGIIKVKTKKGPKIYPFSSSFEVGKPSTTVAASAMNVFYMGIDNPVSVSAPMPNAKASAPGLRQGSGAGQYVMRPTAIGKVTINVSGTDDNGKTVNLGKSEFRVKKIPDPVPYIAGKTGSCTMTKSDLASGVIQAKMEGFEFDLKVQVSSFEIGTTVSGDYKDAKVTGSRMNDAARALIGKASRGQRFYVEKMSVKMPDGTTRTLANINIKII
ncbi:MAG: gliding motility protein GldM [Bacteroidetes bacterium]|nr:gliding motility protein GldM [Bacteroidota bacterium]